MAIYSYLSMLPPTLSSALLKATVPLPGLKELRVEPGLLESYPSLHDPELWATVVAVSRSTREQLAELLHTRIKDRAWTDQKTAEYADFNKHLSYDDPSYRTVINQTDDDGKLHVGFHEPRTKAKPITLPAALAGPAITLFGPPDDEKMCINAMNAWHRRRSDEPALVSELCERSEITVKWGADSEDSKTPFVGDLLSATHNLSRCFTGTFDFTDERGRTYSLKKDHLSIPVKRVPGLGLPDPDHWLDGAPLPLHLVDTVLHLLQNKTNRDAWCLYWPKLENEQEAAYVTALIEATERVISKQLGVNVVGTTRVFVVFETPRAIFRIPDVANALFPYFAGGSLGWHDFLASAARLLKNDPRYRIPVKADPNIVIEHIKASHELLAGALAGTGALRIGGMYGTLFTSGDRRSFEVAMVGYIKDVVTQLRRGLDGFWVAHPDFVRVGIAVVEAWHLDQKDGTQLVTELCLQLVSAPAEQRRLLDFLASPDVNGLDPSHPSYSRRVLASDLEISTLIANDDPEEIRYNVFQALQYLAAWLSGTGCVALPATLNDATGTPVFVRVMDDLATTERSRWEVWAEVHHGRVSKELFEQILREEMAFITNGVDSNTKRIQVPFEGELTTWYPIAERLLHQLMTDPEPVEAVTELLMPFTTRAVREHSNPWERAKALCPGVYREDH